MSQTAVLVSMVPVAGVREVIVAGAQACLIRASSDPTHEAALAGAVAEHPLSNGELLASLERFKPPASWYDEDHEGLY